MLSLNVLVTHLLTVAGQQDHLKLGNFSAWEAFTCGDLAKMLEGGLSAVS